jgi:hypothetical protein
LPTKELRSLIFRETTNMRKANGDHSGHRYATIVVVSPCVDMAMRRCDHFGVR